MAATKKHIVHVNGKKEVRRSDRPYRWAIVGIRDYAVDEARAKHVDDRTEQSNYEYYLGGWRKYDNQWMKPEERAGHELREAAIRALGTYQAYRETVLHDQMARLAARELAGEFITPKVLAWSQTDNAAHRQVRQCQLHGYRAVCLIPVGGEYRDGEIFRDGRKLANLGRQTQEVR
jgi:hypothetical protein